MVGDKEEKKKEKYIIGEIATQTAPVIIDTETKAQYTELTMLAKIANDIEKVKKSLEG